METAHVDTEKTTQPAFICKQGTHVSCPRPPPVPAPVSFSPSAIQQPASTTRSTTVSSHTSSSTSTPCPPNGVPLSLSLLTPLTVLQAGHLGPSRGPPRQHPLRQSVPFFSRPSRSHVSHQSKPSTSFTQSTSFPASLTAPRRNATSSPSPHRSQKYTLFYHCLHPLTPSQGLSQVSGPHPAYRPPVPCLPSESPHHPRGSSCQKCAARSRRKSPKSLCYFPQKTTCLHGQSVDFPFSSCASAHSRLLSHSVLYRSRHASFRISAVQNYRVMRPKIRISSSRPALFLSKAPMGSLL
jgi:hypothetical protein